MACRDRFPALRSQDDKKLQGRAHLPCRPILPVTSSNFSFIINLSIQIFIKIII